MIATNHCDIQEQNKDMLVLLASLVVHTEYRLSLFEYQFFVFGRDPGKNGEELLALA